MTLYKLKCLTLLYDIEDPKYFTSSGQGRQKTSPASEGEVLCSHKHP